MSRSYKKNNVDKQQGKCKRFYKRLANRKVRRTKNLGDFCYYKRVFESWDISDWRYWNELSAKELEATYFFWLSFRQRYWGDDPEARAQKDFDKYCQYLKKSRRK